VHVPANEQGGAPPSPPERVDPGGVRVWTDPAPGGFGDGATVEGRELLERIFALAPTATLRDMPGRQTFGWPDRPGLVVKRFRGGEPRDWWYERFRGAPRSPGRREGENLLALAADGLPVPRAMAWVEEPASARLPRGARGGRSAVVMELVEHEQSLRAALDDDDAERRAELGEALLALVTRLHRAGWYHRDLYLQHVVLRADGQLCLLDVGRARRESSPSRRWLVKDLAALLHSTPRAVNQAERLGFLRDWLAASPRAEVKELRWWVRAILAKRRRLAAHTPRHVDPRTAGEEPR
jgi:hypothetical protein